MKDWVVEVQTSSQSEMLSVHQAVNK